jgi:hypothetical protein
MMTMKTGARLLLVLFAATFLSACTSVRIAQIKSDPTQFRNKTVRVNGTVTNSFGVLSTGFYELEDDTGKIFVISNRGVPSRGAQVRVEGSVFSGAVVGGQSLGVAIRENKHTVR